MEATAELRTLHGIENNGTIAYFAADPKRKATVPRFSTMQEELANNYLLRKIMTNPRRKVYLVDKDSNKGRRLRYQHPTGKEIIAETLSVPYEGRDYPIHVSVWRSDTELTQSGDDRQGGLLITDDENMVLDISMFRYDNEPLAVRFFGEARIEGFRYLLQKEEAVLSDDRQGLARRHPFCATVILELEQRILKMVKEENKRREREARNKIDREEVKRFRKAFSILNEIAEYEAQVAENLGQKPSDDIAEPPDGFCLYPSSAEITVGKRYNLELRIDTEVVWPGSVVQIESSNQSVQVLTDPFRITTDESRRIIQKYITIVGREASTATVIRATAADCSSESKVFVIPEKELLKSEGMVFNPGTCTLRPNRTRKVHLLVYVRLIHTGSRITITSDNESIHVSKDAILVNEADAERHLASYEVEIWGEGEGQQGIITAEFENYMALLEVRVRSKENPPEEGRKGMFSEPEFDFDPEPRQRTHYSSETAKVIVYVNFPSTKMYLGENCCYRKTLPAQVLVADLVAERCFYEIARRKVEKSGAIIRPEAKADRIQRDAFVFSRKYGKKVHEAMVDAQLLEQSRKDLNG